MNILAIDTATYYLSLGLSSNGNSYLVKYPATANQSLHILPQIQNLLIQAQLDLAQINLIAYNQGPGSFTGLRIGLSVALGIAYSISCKLIGIPTFVLLAASLQSQQQSAKQLLVMLDAQLGQLFIAVLDLANLSYLLQPQLINPNECSAILTANAIDCTNLLITGNGWDKYHTYLPPIIALRDCYIAPDYPNASYLLQLAQTNLFTPCEVFEAKLLYLRTKVALNLQEQQKIKHAN